MKNSNIWKFGLLFLGAVVLTGCTQSFATVQDKANVLAAYEQTEVTVGEETKTQLENIVDTVNDTGVYFAPSEAFFNYIEKNVATRVREVYSTRTVKHGEEVLKNAEGNPITYDELTVDQLLNDTNVRSIYVKTNEYALVKYAKEEAKNLDELWSNYNKWIEEAVNFDLTLVDVGSSYYHSFMKQQFDAHLATVTAYITPEGGTFDNIQLEGKSWGQAFEYGLIEGLLVWPISTLIYYLSMKCTCHNSF